MTKTGFQDMADGIGGALLIGTNLVLVLHGDTRIGTVPVPVSSAPGDYFATTWGFYLVPRGDGTTRLIARFRNDYNQKLANTMMYGPPLVEPISCVMQRRMLLGIRQRVEAASAQVSIGNTIPSRPGVF
jgi:hypothetical protein